MTKVRVAAAHEIEAGKIHRATIGEIELILIRSQGEIRAYSGCCPHQHAPLADGLLSGNRIVCPWHQAVFHAGDGRLVEPPALEGLETFAVEVRGDDVWIEAIDGVPQPHRSDVVEMGRPVDGRTVVVVGAGAAGIAAAQELRRSGFAGRVIMISQDIYPPYDRTHCSKDYLAGEAPAEWLPLKTDAFYHEEAIELIHHRVDSIDVETRRVALPGGAEIEADGLVLAMGSHPRRLPVPGADLDGVMTLRTQTDSDRIADRADDADHVVVVGASFIGMEVAASLKQRGVANVTVVAPDDVPFEKTLGRNVGSAFRRLHETNGISFELGRTVEEIIGQEPSPRSCSTTAPLARPISWSWGSASDRRRTVFAVSNSKTTARCSWMSS